MSRNRHRQSRNWLAEGAPLSEQQWDLGAFSRKERGVGEAGVWL